MPSSLTVRTDRVTIINRTDHPTDNQHMALSEQLRHPKETGYFTAMAIFSGMIWLPIIPFAIGGFFIFIPLVFFAWLSSLYFKAVILGTSVKVTAEQYPQIHARAVEICRQLHISSMPDIYIVNSNGVINAIAYKALDKKYVFLYSSLVDLLLMKGHSKELDFILAHELGHHAAGHVSFWKNLLLFWGKKVPLIGAAYSRACELTADRIGHHIVNDVQVSTRALAALALGSGALVESLNIEAFKRQDAEIPELMGFIHKVFSSHPRTTRRVIEIEGFEEYNRFLHTKTAPSAPPPTTPYSANASASAGCPECGKTNDPNSAFCESCGHKLK